jgi:hypothetical protein
MRTVNDLIENALDFFGKESKVILTVPDEEESEETQAQRRQHKAEIKQAIDDIRRLESIVARRV